MRPFRLLALLGVTAWWVGCGLPDSYFIQPPAVGTQASYPGTNFFSITGTDHTKSDTGATFKGYELYYKFYGNNADSTFNSDLTSFGTGSTNTDLQQAGFHRLCLGQGTAPGLVADTSAGYASAPLINIENIDSAHKNDTYTVTIKLNDGAPSPPVPPVASNGPPTSYFVYTPPGVPNPAVYAEVRRFVTLVPGPGCKTFQSNGNNSYRLATNYDTTGWSDADLSGTTGQAVWAQVLNPNNGSIYVMMYAFSYGKSIIDGTPVYSSPVNLGTVYIPVYP